MTVTRLNPKEELFWWMDIIIPSVLGIALYLVMNSDHMVSAIVWNLFGPGKTGNMTEGMFRLLSIYSRDFLWSYALVFALSYWFRDSREELRKAYIIAGIFEILVVVWQFASVIGGTFDVGHLLGIVTGDIMAILVILIHKRAVL